MKLTVLGGGADVLLAEASCPWEVPPYAARHLSSARQSGQLAGEAGARRLVLTHLMPGTSHEESARAAAGGKGNFRLG